MLHANQLFEYLNSIDDTKSLNKITESVDLGDVEQLKTDLSDIEGFIVRYLTVSKQGDGVRIRIVYLYSKDNLNTPDDKEYSMKNLNITYYTGGKYLEIRDTDYGKEAKKFIKSKLNAIINRYPEFIIKQDVSIGTFTVLEDSYSSIGFIVNLRVGSKSDGALSKKFSKNEIIYRYNFGLPLSDKEIALMGTPEEHKRNADKVKEIINAIKQWDPECYSITKQRDWTSLLLIIRRDTGGYTKEEVEELSARLPKVFNEIHVSGGSTYGRYNGCVDISPDKPEMLTEGLSDTSGKIVTESDIRAALDSWKANIPFGFLAISDKAVRYTTEELDMQEYAWIADLVREVNADPDVTLEDIQEDPAMLLDYFDVSCGMHHYFELEDFIEQSSILNRKYFGQIIVDEVDNELRANIEDSDVLQEEVDSNMKKLQDAAASVKCKLTPGFIEYATEDPELLDDAIESELLYCGKVLCGEFPEMTSWEFGEDDDLTDQYGNYCVVETGTDEGRILVQLDGHGRIYNLE